MPRKSSLRSVSPGEKAPRRAPSTIAAAAKTGDSRDLLVALRNKIAKTLDDPKCPARDQASLSRRLLEIRKEIEAVDAKAEQESRESTVPADAALDAEAL